MTSPLTIQTDIDEIVENFSFLEDWEDRYGYLIELGKALTPLNEVEQSEANKVKGCVSQVWVVGELDNQQSPPVMNFRGASDAHIVRGLVAVALALFSGRPPAEIETLDEQETFTAIGLEEHLTPQRANGLRAMVQRLKAMARSDVN